MDTIRRSWKLQEFVAHKANVNCLAMGHKSNQVLATGGDDKKVNLWAIGRQGCLMSLSGHTTPVECVCFGHSEDLVCAGSQTGALKIWDLEAAKLLRTFTGHKGAIKCMDFHPYGDYLTTGSCDSNIKLWDTRKRGCIVTYSSHRLAVNSLQFSPDGQWIASACEDGFVKVWDVRVGKVLQEFVEHTSGVTCVKFHPHEFLLASCGTDRTVNFWDMEKFQLVSKFEKDNTSIRHMTFSDDGATLLGCGNDGLHVIGWEPARVLDTINGHWGQIHDITVAQTQLIAGSFHSTYVVLSVVDLSKVHPFGGPPPAVTTAVRDLSPFQKGQSVRKSFSKEKPPKEVMHRPTPLDEKTAEESTSGTEADEESGAVIPNINDYTEIFRPSRALTRTPPPATSLSSEDFSIIGLEGTSKPEGVTTAASTSLRALLLEERPRDSRIPTPNTNSTANHYSAREKKPQMFSRIVVESNKDENLYPTTQTSTFNEFTANTLTTSLNRHNSYKESKSAMDINPNSLRQSNSEVSLGPPSLGPRSLSFTRPPSQSSRARLESTGPQREIEREPEPEFVPYSVDRPVGLDLDEFLPRGLTAGGARRGARGGAAEPSEQEVLGVMMRGHDSMMAVLAARQRALQIFHSVRINKSLKSALESAIALDDASVILDILNVMAHKPSLWNLDVCLLMLPKIYELLQSKYETYMQCGCNALRLIVRNFSSVVRANVSAPVRTLGVDIPREERYTKCVQIHRLLLDIRAFLLKRQTLQGRLGAAFRDLHTLMQQGLD
ncbi:katanin p80 WD40 repeat-containing subunit B1 isoform X1 [Pararge aegeria]|uniref:Katanin p80 WD40 repeat-containing subunit B1 n=6 Tax=Pararge aegeria TaxID=116150 RepID=A0A8S4SR30_9NEOP|nr:katanin p80 WD40 repeat-containing subunit B1 isoform X1 [Pararge aegeria]XP_039764009.1 katanin p80 WD40 repeat-containing subunit B1 isoform X1 [Pararge aegeria]CAH2268808.1 jg8984 [Pararge aegeria aegeria]